MHRTTMKKMIPDSTQVEFRMINRKSQLLHTLSTQNESGIILRNPIRVPCTINSDSSLLLPLTGAPRSERLRFPGQALSANLQVQLITRQDAVLTTPHPDDFPKLTRPTMEQLHHA